MHFFFCYLYTDDGYTVLRMILLPSIYTREATVLLILFCCYWNETCGDIRMRRERTRRRRRRRRKMRIFSHQSSDIFILFCSPLIGAHMICSFSLVDCRLFRFMHTCLIISTSSLIYILDMLCFLWENLIIYMCTRNYEFNKIFCIYYRILRICVTRNISKTVSNIKSMYCGEEKAVQKKVCTCILLLHIYTCATYVLLFFFFFFFFFVFLL